MRLHLAVHATSSAEVLVVAMGVTIKGIDQLLAAEASIVDSNLISAVGHNMIVKTAETIGTGGRDIAAEVGMARANAAAIGTTGGIAAGRETEAATGMVTGIGTTATAGLVATETENAVGIEAETGTHTGDRTPAMVSGPSRATDGETQSIAH